MCAVRGSGSGTMELSLPYTTGIGYEAWKQEIVNWIPKENNNPDINKRRPVHGNPTGQNNADLEK
jgi:hypothetical protein